MYGCGLSDFSDSNELESGFGTPVVRGFTFEKSAYIRQGNRTPEYRSGARALPSTPRTIDNPNEFKSESAFGKSAIMICLNQALAGKREHSHIESQKSRLKCLIHEIKVVKVILMSWVSCCTAR